MTILMRPIIVPIGEVRWPGKPVPVVISTEWHRTIEQLVQAVNDLQTENAALTARIAALEP